jgi:hypothetical protein
VDAHVSKYLFDECICGVLRGKTRVLVTHQLQYLNKPEVNHIIVIKDNTVVEQGSFAELSQAGGEMHRLMMDFGGGQSNADAAAIVTESSASLQIDVSAPKSTSVVPASVDSAAPVLSPAVNASAEPVSPSTQGKVIEIKEAASGLGGKGRAGGELKLMTQEEKVTGSLGLSVRSFRAYVAANYSWHHRTQVDLTWS